MAETTRCGDLLQRAGIGQQGRPGRHVIEILSARQELDTSVQEVRDLFAALTKRAVEAVEILQTYKHDDEARQAALAVLTGGAE